MDSMCCGFQFASATMSCPDPTIVVQVSRTPAMTFDDPSNNAMNSSDVMAQGSAQAHSATGVRRSRGGGSGALTAEQKRERNRATVKRFYYKCLETLRTLREEADSLDHQYRTMVASIQNQTDLEVHNQAIQQQPPQDASHMYVELARVKDSLSKENEALRQMVTKQMRVRRRLERVVDAQDDETSEDEDMEHSPAIDMLGHKVASPRQAQMLMPEISADECTQIAMLATERIRSITPLQDAELTSLVNWQCRYRTVDGNLHYTCHKTFSKLTAREIADRTWKMWVSPDDCETMFTSALRTRTQLLRKINQQHAIMSRSLEHDDKDVVVKTVFLLSLLPIENNGFAVVFVGVQGPNFRQHANFDISLTGINKREQWVDMLYWTRVYPTENPSVCAVESGGVIPPYLDLTTRFWTIESLLMASLWETRVFGFAWFPPSKPPIKEEAIEAQTQPIARS